MRRGIARDDNGCREREKQRGNLRGQTIADGQRDINIGSLAERHIIFGHANDEAANNIDAENEQAGNRVTFHEFRGTIHGAVEIGFTRDFFAATLGFFRSEQSGIEFSINRHLLAGHRIQGEARGNF